MVFPLIEKSILGKYFDLVMLITISFGQVMLVINNTTH